MTIAALSVSDLTKAIKSELESLFPFVRVKGEISNCKLHGSGHAYLTLKDNEAQIPVVIWRNVRARYPLELKDGMEVIADGRLEVYPPSGRYQLVCSAIEKSGQGEQQQALAQLIARLAQAGWFSPEKKKSIPRYPRTIGLITSPTGAVIQDMSDVFARRFPPVSLILYPVKVQGDRAVESVLQAFDWFNDPPEPAHRPDLLILARGGGSAEDLRAFNDEAVAEAIFHCEIPVISAIGHETDLTVADMVADLRAGTPSIAAERAVPDREELKRHISSLLARQAMIIESKITGAERQVASICSSYAFNRPVQAVDQIDERIRVLVREMSRGAGERLLREERRYETVSDKLRLLDLRQVLKRGFALVSLDGHYVTSSAELPDGADIRIFFHDGARLATLNEKTGS